MALEEGEEGDRELEVEEAAQERPGWTLSPHSAAGSGLLCTLPHPVEPVDILGILSLYYFVTKNLLATWERTMQGPGLG